MNNRKEKICSNISSMEDADDILAYTKSLFKNSLFWNDNELKYNIYIKLKSINELAAKDCFYEKCSVDFKTNIKNNMVYICGGDFEFGNHDNSKYKYIGEDKIKKMYIEPFSILNTPVTIGMYKEFCPSYNTKFSDKYPVTNITWYDAVMFALWAGCELPTEYEWEYVCKEGKDDEWFSKETCLENYAWFSENSNSLMHEVALLNSNEYGVYDMLGNVWEWTMSNYKQENRKTESHQEMEENEVCKVIKGGSYHGFKEMCRGSIRLDEPADYWADDVGFRVIVGGR